MGDSAAGTSPRRDHCGPCDHAEPTARDAG
jgi:hypothetical protein